MNQDQLSGIIHHFIFENSANGFSVFVLSHKKLGSITVTGTFSNVQPGQEIHLQGAWKFHQKFGKQFVAENYTTALPKTVSGIKRYLGSGLIKGIGKGYAEKIVNQFGENTLTIIDESPDRLCDIEGIGQKRITQIKESWQDQKYIAKIMVFLQEQGISSTYATKIYKKYKQMAIAVLTENPYRLTDDIWGIGFKTADQIAQNMGFATGSLKRIKAGILFCITEATSSGHLYQEVEQLKKSSFQVLELDPDLHAASMKSAFNELYQDDKIKIVTHDEEHFITLSSLYGTEKSVAHFVKNLLYAASAKKYDLKKMYDLLEKEQTIELHEQQKRGILSSFEHKVSVITGGPGTGKTTLLSSLLKILDHEQISYKLAAPTGRAAKRMMEATRRFASTIHRMLEFDPSTMKFQKNEQSGLKAEFIIIDETSMIDIFLANAIIKAIPNSSHLIFIGDIDQLPSVGPGAVLQHLIQSNTVHCTKLEHIFRQSEQSMITSNAHLINQGELPQNNIPGTKKDFYFIREEKPELVFEHIKKIFSITLKKFKIKQDNCAVLTPMNKGAVGTHKLNFDLQQFLNPLKTHEIASYAGTTYKKNDRVMQIKNNYDKNIFNGDIGTIQSIDTENKTLIINFYGTNTNYNFDELEELTLAYAATIHKSQGSEYDAVIIPIFTQHFTLLQRNLLYTGITRAKKLCIFIGQIKAMAIGVKNNKKNERICFLDKMLSENLSCR